MRQHTLLSRRCSSAASPEIIDTTRSHYVANANKLLCNAQHWTISFASTNALQDLNIRPTDA
jgi:hypothetical protein